MIFKKKNNYLSTEDKKDWHLRFAWKPTRVNRKEVHWFKKIARKEHEMNLSSFNYPKINRDKTWLKKGYLYADTADLMQGKLAGEQWAETREEKMNRNSDQKEAYVSGSASISSSVTSNTGILSSSKVISTTIPRSTANQVSVGKSK